MPGSPTPSEPFLRNAWYVAEIATHVARTPVGVRILDEPIVLYRKESGEAVALENACAHRKLPLSMGRLRGDRIECGYHGMTYDSSGTCTLVPGNAAIPPTARVRGYPIAERYGFLWVWMGAPQDARVEEIFQVTGWDDAEMGRTDPDSMTVACNYLYITDNLLDPSHVAWVHATSFGASGCEQTPLVTAALPEGMVVSRWMLDDDVAPFYAKFVRFKGRTDRQQHYEVRFPSHAIIRAVFAPTGTGAPDGSLHPDTFVMDSYNFMTPVNATTTRYFWFQTRNFAPGDRSVSQAFAQSVRDAFLEDKAILEAVQIGMATTRTAHIDLAIDQGPTRFRRRLKQKIAAEIMS
ncbi:MAG: aromatic ring-hydroxylating dioxygenase subunit alpha [Gammaproteobacteria bacterium]